MFPNDLTTLLILYFRFGENSQDDGDEESETEAAKEPADVKKTKASKK